MEQEPNFNDVLRWLHRGVTDAATVALGLGVLGINRAQVIRHELKKVFCEAPREPGTADINPHSNEV